MAVFAMLRPCSVVITCACPGDVRVYAVTSDNLALSTGDAVCELSLISRRD